MERQHGDGALPGGRVWSLVCDGRHARCLHIIYICPFTTQVARRGGHPVQQELSLIF
jgi:hypothetical protein